MKCVQCSIGWPREAVANLLSQWNGTLSSTRQLLLLFFPNHFVSLYWPALKNLTLHPYVCGTHKPCTLAMGRKQSPRFLWRAFTATLERAARLCGPPRNISKHKRATRHSVPGSCCESPNQQRCQDVLFVCRKNWNTSVEHSVLTYGLPLAKTKASTSQVCLQAPPKSAHDPTEMLYEILMT